MKHLSLVPISNVRAAKNRLNRISCWLIAVLCFFAGDSAIAAAQTKDRLVNTTGLNIRVAPTGRDLDPNLLQAAGAAVIGPVRNLENALAIARRIRRIRHGSLDISIELDSGTYRFEKSVLFSVEDSGTFEHPLKVRGKADGSTRILGTEQLEQADASALLPFENRLAPAARGKVQIFKLPRALAPSVQIDVRRLHAYLAPPVPFEIFDEAGALRPARWPNDGWIRIASVYDNASSKFMITSDRLRGWQDEQDFWAAGYFKEDWSFEAHSVVSVDSPSKLVSLATSPTFGIKPDARVFFYHALSELDQPGEWYRDRGSNLLIVWPRPEGTGRTAPEISIADAALVLNGANHIHIEHLNIERFRGHGIKVLDGQDIVVSHSSIRWTGGVGANFKDSTDSGIRQSLIADSGEGGVILDGGNRKSLTPGHLFANNCRILRFSRLGRTYKPAVDVAGVGNTVSGNFIAGSPHVAIYFSGNEHRIELNEISDVLTETSDAGAIYTGRDWTARGTILRHNFLHDLRAAPDFEIKGIYLDDAASGIEVTGNLFLRVDQPVFIGGGRDNAIVGNLIIASDPAIHIDGRGLTWAEESFSDPRSELRQSLMAMPFRSLIWRTRYPLLFNLLDDDPGTPKRNRSNGNLFLAGAGYRLLPEVDPNLQQLGPEAIVEDFSPTGISARATAEIKTAADVAKRLQLQVFNAGLGALPLMQMDRNASVAGPGAPD